MALLTWRVLVPALRADDFAIVSDAAGGAWAQDFAPILNFAKGFWRGAAGYDVESFVRVTEERVGRPVQHALPFPYLPTMLWLLGPFCLLPDAWSYVLWSLLGVAAVGWVTRGHSSPWLLAALFSPTAFWCFGMGQTSVLTTAALFFLMVRDLDERTSRRSDWPDAAVIWMLAAKPPLALTASVALIARGRWRPVLLGAVMTIVTTAALAPLLQADWLLRYVALLQRYDRDTADPVYALSLVPELMGNLRALLHVTLGMRDAVAMRTSSVAWMVALMTLAVVAPRRRLPGEAVWSFAILAYLLLCPHVTGTEELTLMLPLGLFANQAGSRMVRWPAIASVLVVLYVTPLLGRMDPLRVPLAVAAKGVLVGLVTISWVAPDRRVPRQSVGVTDMAQGEAVSGSGRT